MSYIYSQENENKYSKNQPKKITEIITRPVSHKNSVEIKKAAKKINFHLENFSVVKQL